MAFIRFSFTWKKWTQTFVSRYMASGRCAGFGRQWIRSTTKSDFGVSGKKFAMSWIKYYFNASGWIDTGMPLSLTLLLLEWSSRSAIFCFYPVHHLFFFSWWTSTMSLNEVANSPSLDSMCVTLSPMSFMSFLKFTI